MVLKLKKIMIVLLSTIAFNRCSCDNEFMPFDENGLTYKNKLKYENQFRIDGMYYEYDENGYNINIFYSDGVFYNAGHDNLNINNIDCIKIDDQTKKIPYYWGYYIISNDTIKVQTYDPSSYGRHGEYKVEERIYIILNETTIKFLKIVRKDVGIIIMNRICHFKKCTNKPDSTNVLME